MVAYGHKAGGREEREGNCMGKEKEGGRMGNGFKEGNQEWSGMEGKVMEERRHERQCVLILKSPEIRSPLGSRERRLQGGCCSCCHV